MSHVYHFSMQKLLETTYQSTKHVFLIYFTDAFSWCILKKLNWYLPLLMTIAYLQHFSKLYQNYKLYFSFVLKQSFGSCDLIFYKLPPLKENKVQHDPLWFIAVCLSVFINYALIHKLRMYALRIFHSSISIHK